MATDTVTQSNHALTHSYVESAKRSDGYRLVSQFYGLRKAKRSGVPLINHINEGLEILARLNSTTFAMEAFCIHPLLQADSDLATQYLDVVRHIKAGVVLYAMEYRNIANAWLSDKVRTVEYTRGHFTVETIGQPKLSPLVRVNDMLIADKVQNRKDFLEYHADSHQRSGELTVYFDTWLKVLGLTEERYEELIKDL